MRGETTLIVNAGLAGVAGAADVAGVAGFVGALRALKSSAGDPSLHRWSVACLDPSPFPAQVAEGFEAVAPCASIDEVINLYNYSWCSRKSSCRTLIAIALLGAISRVSCGSGSSGAGGSASADPVVQAMTTGLPLGSGSPVRCHVSAVR
jgi:hypothetical protein